jgi:hypothetical protein
MNKNRAIVTGLILVCSAILINFVSRSDPGSRNMPIVESPRDSSRKSLPRAQGEAISAFKASLERGDSALASAELIKNSYIEYAEAVRLVSTVDEEVIVHFLRGMGDDIHRSPDIGFIYMALMDRLIDLDPRHAVGVIAEIGPKHCDPSTFSHLVASAFKDDFSDLISAIDSSLFPVEEWPRRIGSERLMQDMVASGRTYDEVLKLLGTIPDNGNIANAVAIDYFSHKGVRRKVLESERESIYEFIGRSKNLARGPVLEAMKKEWGFD